MSIKLDIILRRNKSNLYTFISKNKLTSYTHLVEYCDSRKFIPCTEKEYNEVINAKKLKRVVKNEKKPSRKSSNTQKVRKARVSNKRKQVAPRVLDDHDDGKN